MEKSAEIYVHRNWLAAGQESFGLALALLLCSGGGAIFRLLHLLLVIGHRGTKCQVVAPAAHIHASISQLHI